MRDGDSSVYEMFCDKVLSHVIGRDIWKRRCHMHTLTDIATVSDEAFALFLLENSWEVYVAVATKDEDIPAPKYSVQGPGTKMYKGWTDEGIARFNQLFDDVKANRTGNKGVFDEALKNKKLAEMAAKKKKRQRPVSLPLAAPVVQALSLIHI